MKTIDYNAYPFGRGEKVPSAYIYAFIKDQLDYITGFQKMECPHCRNLCTAKVSRLQVARQQTCKIFRSVNIKCMICNTSISFRWVWAQNTK